MFAVILVYSGFVAMFLGTLAQICSLRVIGIRDARRGLKVFASGFLLYAGGLAFPAFETRVNPPQSHLDEFAPIYQFSEFHSIRVAASKGRVYDAIRSVSAGEISYYRMLTWVRRLGRPGHESILNAPPHEPLVDVAVRTGFLLLAAEPNREIVNGTAVLAPDDWQPKQRVIPAEFKALRQPGFALAAINFRIEETGPDSCMVTTETRVYATDAQSRRKFARYWRLIYPGSSLIRRMWLRAIKRLAEAAP